MRRANGQESDDEPELAEELLAVEPPESDVELPEVSDFVEPAESPPLELLGDADVDPDVSVLLEADDVPRLSVLKKPDPLNVTPTGRKTFLTGSTSPESGWAISVRASSWNPCWTSIVSPDSTNL